MHELMNKGGPIMWPLLACSITALAVILERLIFWITLSVRKDQPRVIRIFTLTEAGDFDAAIREGEGSRCLVFRILTAGLAHRNYGLVQSLEAAAMQEIEKMKRYLSVLDTIITLAPLLVIHGTVTGISVGGSGFSETPGLGAKAKDAAFTDQFSGKKTPVKLGDTDGEDTVDAITAATISSRAALECIRDAIAKYQKAADSLKADAAP